MKKKIQTLFNNLCCSHCKSCFTEESFSIKREEDGLVVAHLECKNCDKKFGVALLGFSDIEFAEQLEVQEGPEAINYNDVIDAHRFIRDLDENWQQYIQKNAQ